MYTDGTEISEDTAIDLYDKHINGFLKNSGYVKKTALEKMKPVQKPDSNKQIKNQVSNELYCDLFSPEIKNCRAIT